MKQSGFACDPGLFHALTLHRENVREQIADSIQDMAAAHRLQPGTQLPSERDLARALGVNRATVREAMRILEQRGLVQMKLGMGTFIANVASSTVAECIGRYYAFSGCSEEDMVKLSEMLDPELAALAADRATGDDIGALGECVNRLEQTWAQGDAVAYAGADAAFHVAIATATHNQLVSAISSGLQKIVRSLMLAQSSPRQLESGAISHRAVYEAIAARDAGAARSAMRAHHIFTRAAEGRQGDGAVMVAGRSNLAAEQVETR
jgi:GntR family transcriptional regulator, transcriptional repressor for pyruvate dehydrogenase complex